VLDLVEEFRTLVDALEREGVSYAVCGGLALAVHAHPRATLDVDLLAPPEDVAQVCEVARTAGYHLDAGLLRKGVIEMHRLSKPDPETGDLLSLDVLRVTPALASAWEGRERIRWEHGEIPVVSREGLVAMKRLRGSGQDLDDIRALEPEDSQDEDPGTR